MRAASEAVLPSELTARGAVRGPRGSRIEASHRGKGPRPQRPTGNGAVSQPVTRQARRWRSRRDPAGRCRSHSRRLARAGSGAAAARPGPAQPSGGGGARPARTAPARARRPGAVLPCSARLAGAAVGEPRAGVLVSGLNGG